MSTAIEEIYKEICSHQRAFNAGKMSLEKAQMNAVSVSQKLNCIRQIDRIFARGKKSPQKYLNILIKKRIVSENTVIDVFPEEIEEEKVYCELQNKSITRSECLDYSGESNHMDDCKNCETGLANKKLLISGPPLYTV